MTGRIQVLPLLVPTVALLCGCHSPYYADRGAAIGGLTGAGAGAIIGDAVGGSAAKGAVIGAGLGALTGTAVGQGMDEMETRTRAQIAQQLGRPVQEGTVTIAEVVAMTEAKVPDRLVISHIRHTGVASPPTSSDIIYLTQHGVSADVIEALQSPPPARSAPGPPVIVEQYPYVPPPCVGPPYGPHRPPFHPRPPHIAWGVSVAR